MVLYVWPSLAMENIPTSWLQKIWKATYCRANVLMKGVGGCTIIAPIAGAGVAAVAVDAAGMRRTAGCAS